MAEYFISFPGGSRVDAEYGSFIIKTDQPPSSTAPTPFSLFLASMGTCAGIYVLGFCQQRGLPTDGIRIVQRMDRDPLSGLYKNIELEIQVPPDFPEKYHASLVRSEELCAVKKHLENPPKFDVHTTVVL